MTKLRDRKRIDMAFRRDRGHNVGAAIVVLPDNATAVASVEELQDTSLLYRKVTILIGLIKRTPKPSFKTPQLGLDSHK
jgi:hypothetical protein